MVRSVSQTATITSGYRTIAPLAQGGMGRVEIVVRQEDGFERLYAIKRLHAHLLQDADLVNMFLDEARLGGLIRHANVVSVLDVGTDEQGPFFVMDYVDGESVSKICRLSCRDEAQLPVQTCVRIIKQAADGLHSAHELTDGEGKPLRLVHRDVSPQNLLVGFDGTVRLTDFGIAKALGASTETTVGTLKGKKGYFSPEQLRFEILDRRSDIFSLGVVLYELLAATRLYGGSAEVSYDAILNGVEPDVGQIRSDIPAPLSELLFRMLAKDREHRPASARDVARELDCILAQLVADEGIVGLTDYMEDAFGDSRRARSSFLRAQRRHRSVKEAAEQAHPPPARGPTWKWLFVIGCLVAVGVGTWWWYGSQVARQRIGASASMHEQASADERSPVTSVTLNSDDGREGDPAGEETRVVETEEAQNGAEAGSADTANAAVKTVTTRPRPPRRRPPAPRENVPTETRLGEAWGWPGESRQ